MGPLATPKKGVEGHCTGDPWTPTSNLKILISAASPDIRNREKELTLEEEAADEDPQEVEEAERMTSRKDKSLGLLCHKFLERFEDFPDPEKNNDISLDDVASELNVERRRIYDIMNVLESLHMVSRSAKNHYAWHGRTKLSQTLFVLKKVGEEQGYHRQMKQLRLRLAAEEEEDKENQEGAHVGGHQQSKELFFVELPGVEFKAASVNSRKDKSLRVMSQKFVMLFLVARPRVVSLDVAAQILIGEDLGEALDKNKFKTKVRRLYDIANVLRSLKLIEKVHVTEERGRKPAFEWVGPEEFTQVKDSEVKAAGGKASASRPSRENCAKNLFSNKRFTRHPSLMKLAKSIEEDRRKINSAPSSPARGAAGDSAVDFPNKMAQLAAICKIQLDHESSEVKPSDPARTPLPSTPVTPVAPLIPIMLPQHQTSGGGAYAVYVPPPQLRAARRPQPTSLAVRSMTFDSPTALKRPGAEEGVDLSPSKTQRRDLSFRDVSPKLGGILQARLASHAAPPLTRPAPRALHLDPEFQCPSDEVQERSPSAAEQSVEAFMEREEQSGDTGGATPVRAVPLTPTAIHAETLVPAGYLIPLSQASLIGFKDLQSCPKDKPATPTLFYHTPPPGFRPAACQELTPPGGNVAPVSRAPPLCTSRTLSPSPAIINFTMQNLGLISGHPQVQTPNRTPTGALLSPSPQPGPLPVPLLSHRPGMVFLKPVSPLQVQGTTGGQQVALISLQQPLSTTPKSSSSPGFFQTPVSIAPLASVAAATGPGVANSDHAVMFMAQRKLDVGAEDF